MPDHPSSRSPSTRASALPSRDPTPATLAWVARELGCRAVLAVTPLSVRSTAVHAVLVELAGGGTERFALRRFVDAGRLATDPWYVPRHEAAALALLHPTDVPAPRLVAADVEALVCDAPALLTTVMPGRPGDGRDVPPGAGMLAQLAAVLPAIHDTGGPGLDALPRYEPYGALEGVRVPSWADREVWSRARSLVTSTPPPGGAHRLIHRDYHPGNTLWHGATLCGVVDWTTACLGPPAVDLARMRQNLALLHGPPTAERFRLAYERETGRDADRHPWWDLRDALDLLPDVTPPRDAAAGRALSRWEAYVAAVAAEL